MCSKFIIHKWYKQSDFEKMKGWDEDKIERFKKYLTKCSDDMIREYVEKALDNFNQYSDSDSPKAKCCYFCGTTDTKLNITITGCNCTKSPVCEDCDYGGVAYTYWCRCYEDTLSLEYNERCSLS
jgi:hypothetical protein